MAAPTLEELRKRLYDGSVWLDAENLRAISTAINALPSTDMFGGDTMLEIWHPEQGYRLGWALINPEINEWTFVPVRHGDPE